MHVGPVPATHTAPLLQDSAGEPLYKLFKAIKHQVEKGPVDAVQKKAKYTLNDTGLLGDDIEYAPLVSAPEPEAAGWKLEPGTWTQQSEAKSSWEVVSAMQRHGSKGPLHLVLPILCSLADGERDCSG